MSALVFILSFLKFAFAALSGIVNVTLYVGKTCHDSVYVNAFALQADSCGSVSLINVDSDNFESFVLNNRPSCADGSSPSFNVYDDMECLRLVKAYEVIEHGVCAAPPGGFRAWLLCVVEGTSEMEDETTTAGGENGGGKTTAGTTTPTTVASGDGKEMTVSVSGVGKCIFSPSVITMSSSSGITASITRTVSIGACPFGPSDGGPAVVTTTVASATHTVTVTGGSTSSDTTGGSTVPSSDAGVVMIVPWRRWLLVLGF